MLKWRIVYTKQAQRDAKKLKSSGLKEKTETLLNIIEKDPYQSPPPYEKLIGDLYGSLLCRINIQHRLVYQVLDDIRTVKVVSMWTHNE